MQRTRVLSTVRAGERYGKKPGVCWLWQLYQEGPWPNPLFKCRWRPAAIFFSIQPTTLGLSSDLRARDWKFKWVPNEQALVQFIEEKSGSPVKSY